MKGFNIKKLATIAAGAALVGSAVAPIAAAALTDLTKSDVINADGTPAVDIVVGSSAAVSDVVWAGNIAAKLAQLATTTTAVTGGAGTGTAEVSNVQVKLAVGGTTTVSGGKTFFADMNSASLASSETNFTDQNVTQSNIPGLLYYGSKAYTWNNTSYSTTMQEKLNFTAQALYDSSTKRTLAVQILQGKLKYIADYGSGVPAVEAAGSGSSFADDKNDNVIVPFFGKNYLLKTVTKSSGYVELVETNGEKDYKDGDKIEGLSDANGNTYYMKVGPGGVDGSTNKVKLEIFDSTDTKIDGGYYSSGDVTFYKDGQAFLTTSVNISAIIKATVSQSDVFTATIYIGTARIQLYNSKGYPYDASKAADAYDYTTNLYWSSDNNYLTRIEVVNSSKKVWNASTALGLGESVSYPNNVGTLKVIGLQLPGAGATKTERTTVVEAGVLLPSNGQGLKYKDSVYEANHDIPFNIGGTVPALTGNNGATGTFTMDGKTLWLGLSTTDVNIWASDATGGRVSAPSQTQCIGDSNYVNGVKLNIGIASIANTGTVIGGTTVRVGETVDINGMQFRYSGMTATSCVFLTADGNVTVKKDSSTGTLVQEVWYVDENAAAGADISLAGASDVVAKYTPMVDDYSGTEAGSNISTRIWLLLSDQNFTTQYTKRISLIGTDTSENFVNAVPFYLPNNNLLPADYNGGGNYNVNNYHIVEFRWDESEDGAADGNFLIDGGTGKLIALPNSQLSYYGNELNYNPAEKVNSSVANFKMSENSTQAYPKDAYTDFGTHIVLGSSAATFTFPENQPQFELLLSGTGTVTTTTGGEELTIAEKATGSTTGGTTIEVKEVTYTATCGAGSGACTPSSYEAIVPVGTLVYTDASPPAGKLIIVGGHLVNALARGITDDKLVAAGDVVAEKQATGDIVVAGYTAADTGAAAQELIDALDALS